MNKVETKREFWQMKCLEFKRLALSDPNNRDRSFISHSTDCPECLKFVGSVRQLDIDLSNSLEPKIPTDLVARLLLDQELEDEAGLSNSDSSLQRPLRRYAMAASIVVALFVGGLMISNQFSLSNKIDEDYRGLLAAVVDHMNEQPITPVWESAKANRTVNTLLASYDDKIKIKHMENLQFGRICPMGEYRGLHASLETDDGQITFAYIKGEPVGDLLSASYAGYVTRVKPVRGGNLLIISRNQKSLEQADRELQTALYWEI